MGGFSIWHLLIFAGILLLFFGPSRLPDLGKSIGKAIRGFKEGLNELNAEAKDVGPQKELSSTPQDLKETAAEEAVKDKNKQDS